MSFHTDGFDGSYYNQKIPLTISTFYIILNHIKNSFNTLVIGMNKKLLNKFTEKVFELCGLNKKYEDILEEKSQIIINKTDEIISLREKIEEMENQIKQNENKQLNVIPEMLCSKCGGSLEESFNSEVLTENKKIISEQFAYIEKMQKEISKLKSKNEINESRLKDLDLIKEEFKNLQDAILKEKNDKNDIAIQTDNIENKNSIPKNKKSNNTNKKKTQKQNNKKNNKITTNNNNNNI